MADPKDHKHDPNPKPPPATPADKAATPQPPKAPEPPKQPPKQHQSKARSSMVTTYSGSVADAHLQPIPLEDRIFTKDEIKDLAGDLEPGQIGWVMLDEEGCPTGAATTEKPEPGTTFARVIGSLTHIVDEIVTPSGAPVTKHMNPETDFADAGLLARNPVPEATDEQQKKSEKMAPNQAVVNQPVQT